MFVAFTSTGCGECLAYSKDGGLTFTELEENPVVKHNGRDPKIIWYKPERKRVMAVFDDEVCAETEAVPPRKDSPEGRADKNRVGFREFGTVESLSFCCAMTRDVRAPFSPPRREGLGMRGRAACTVNTSESGSAPGLGRLLFRVLPQAWLWIWNATFRADERDITFVVKRGESLNRIFGAMLHDASDFDPASEYRAFLEIWERPP